MADADQKVPRIILFIADLLHVGGAERVLLEEADFFLKQGIDTTIFTFFSFNKEALFDNCYDGHAEQLGRKEYQEDSIARLVELVRKILILRRRIQKIKPCMILAASAVDCAFLYLATLFTRYEYSSHIHGTLFWFDHDTFKYTRVHRNVFDEIMNSVTGHKQFIPTKPTHLSLFQRAYNEVFAIVMYRGVRKAKKIFVLSNQMRWEVSKLYQKDAIVVKGAFPNDILNYKPKKDFKKEFAIKGELLLNINRLDPRKRIDLLLRSFEVISHKHPNSVLVIGGVGPDEQRLKDLASELRLADSVKFVGYVEESDRWDWIASCDVFVHPNWADFAIAAYEPLALQKKVVWSTEMELDDTLAKNRHIFRAEPTVASFAQKIEEALIAQVDEIDDVSRYTWSNYCDAILNALCA